MEKKLLVEIEKIKLLSSYKTSMTLSENYEVFYDSILSEQSIARDVLYSLRGDLKVISNDLKDLKVFAGDAKAAEDFLTRARAGRASASELGQFSKDVLKSGRNDTAALSQLLDGAAQGYSKQLFNSSENVAEVFRNAPDVRRRALLKQAGYPPQTIEKIMAEFGALEKSSGKSVSVVKDVGTGTKDVGTGAKDLGTGTKDLGTGTKDVGTGAKDSRVGSKGVKATEEELQAAKESADTLKKDQGFMSKLKDKMRNWNWRRIKRWAIALGIGGLVLWWLMKDSGEELPPDFPEDGKDAGKDDGTGGGAGGGGDATGDGSGAGYHDCTGTYTQYCRAQAIRDVQKCLGGLRVDGLWGPKTQAALDKVGYGTSFTDADISTICGKTGQSTTTTTVPGPKQLSPNDPGNLDYN